MATPRHNEQQLLALFEQKQQEDQGIVLSQQQQLALAVTTLLQNEAAVKTNSETLKPYRTERQRAKKHIENHLLQSNDDFVPIGSKFLVKETSSSLAPLSMEIIKFCYITFRMKASGITPSNEEVNMFEASIVDAQRKLGAEDVKIKRKSSKPISYLLKK